MEESIELISYAINRLGIGDMKPQECSPLVLAYLGDGIQDLLMRHLTVSRGERSIRDIHMANSELVNAAAQSSMMRAIQKHLTEEESKIYKRGRNAKSLSPAKNQSLTDYRRATGYEALLGYLYLKKDYARLVELLKLGLDSLSKSDEEKA